MYGIMYHGSISNVSRAAEIFLFWDPGRHLTQLLLLNSLFRACCKWMKHAQTIFSLYLISFKICFEMRARKFLCVCTDWTIPRREDTHREGGGAIFKSRTLLHCVFEPSGAICIERITETIALKMKTTALVMHSRQTPCLTFLSQPFWMSENKILKKISGLHSIS